ncbi:MAG: beta-galactosidase [Eubacteriales bacterium]|nr:beta-galactosidase [Eubacteriales bacterium]
METCWLRLQDLTVLTGQRQGNRLIADHGRIVLSASLPRGWELWETAAVHLNAQAEHQYEIKLGLGDAQQPRLAMHYRVLPKCLVQVPFPLTSKALAVDFAFLPPWPGVFKGGIDGTPTKAEEVQTLSLTLYEPTLKSATLEGIDFCQAWSPCDVMGDALVDELGQCKAGQWPGKTENRKALDDYLRKELTWAEKNNRYPDEWSAYGGWTKKRFPATGWFHTAHDGRRWWLVDPEGYAFFSNGMCYGNRTGIYAMADHIEALYDWLPTESGLESHSWTTGDQIPQYVVRNGLEAAKARRLVNFPRANMMKVFGEKWLDAWITINAARMRSYGINTLGVGVNDYGDEPTAEFLAKAKIPYVITLKYFPLTEQRIFRDFPDVFSEEYLQLAQSMAQKELSPYRDDPYLIGYFVTNEPEWLMNQGVNLAQRLLAASGCTASKKALIHALWERYGDIAKLNEAWQTSLASFDELLVPMVRDSWTEKALTDLNDFHLLLVEKYGQVVSSALKEVAPHHLNLGMRYSHASKKTLCGPLNYFDVFSFNRYGDQPASSAAMIAQGADMPMIVGEWHIGAQESGLDAWGLYYTETQAQRAQAIAYYLEQSTQEPHLTGIHYFEYSDQPYLGRFDGECYQIGIIDVCNRPYPLVAEAFRSFAQRMYPLLDGRLTPAVPPVKLDSLIK